MAGVSDGGFIHGWVSDGSRNVRGADRLSAASESALVTSSLNWREESSSCRIRWRMVGGFIGVA